MKNNLVSAVLFFAAAALAGCDARGNLDNFVGAWQSTAASATVSCSDGTTHTDPLSSRVTFTADVAGGVLEDNGACVAHFDVAGDVLTAAPGQSCWDRPSSATALYVDMETFTTTDGINGADQAAGRLEGVVDAAGVPVTCTWTGTATYQRGPRE